MRIIKELAKFEDRKFKKISFQEYERLDKYRNKIPFTDEEIEEIESIISHKFDKSEYYKWNDKTSEWRLNPLELKKIQGGFYENPSRLTFWRIPTKHSWVENIITKIDDDWWLFYQERRAKNLTEKAFLCDEMEGLVQCLKSVKLDEPISSFE